MRRCQFVVLLLLAFPSPSAAAPIRWDLKDVRLNDGTTVTGYFILDDRDGRVKQIKTDDYSMETTAGSFFTSAAYDSGASSRSPRAVFRVRSNVFETQMLLFVLKGPLTAKAGIVEILRVDELQDSSTYTRSIATGSLVGTPVASIPEPGALALLGMGAVALRRRFTR